MSEAGGRPWKYEEDLYLLQDTGETLYEKAINLNRSEHSCKIKKIRLAKNNDTLEKIEKEREKFFEFYEYMAIRNMAETFNRTVSYITIRIKAYKNSGELERKIKKTTSHPSWKERYIISNYNRIDGQVLADYVGITVEELEGKVRILKKRGLMIPESSSSSSGLGIGLTEIHRLLFPVGTKVSIGKTVFIIEQDLGEMILCKSKNYRECFRKVEFIIDNDLIKKI